MIMKAKILITIFILIFVCTLTTRSQETILSIYYGDTILYIHPTHNASGIQWGGNGTEITSGNGAESLTNGALNTSAIVAQLGDNEGVPYAAKVCDTLSAFGYTDWYLPATGEWYTLAEKMDSIGGPTGSIYWGSYEVNEIEVSAIYFTSPYMIMVTTKSTYENCRCIRREYPSKISNTQGGSYKMKIYPNLAKEEVNILITGITENFELTIYNLQGQKIYNKKIKGIKEEYSETINVSGYSKGTYIVEIKNSIFIKTEKFIVE